MNFLRFTEVILILLAIVVLISQVALPLLRGTKLFPMFRRENELEKQLEGRRQAQVESNLERQLKSRRPS